MKHPRQGAFAFGGELLGCISRVANAWHCPNANAPWAVLAASLALCDNLTGQNCLLLCVL